MRCSVYGFKGANRALQPKALPESVGVDCTNAYPARGDLRPWNLATTVATVPSGRASIYRFGRDVEADSTYWFTWTGTVHVVRGFLASDTTERTYYTGDGVPKVTDNTIALASAPYPTAARILGLPKPTVAPTLTQSSSGTGDDETRFYVWTWVNDWGWESAPSPPTSIVCKPGAVIDISALPAAPAGNYGFSARRIYRTQAGESGSAEFFFLLEILSSATTSQDDARALGEALVTNGPTGESGRAFTPPPDDLSHLTGMWNGMMAGISGRSVRYCEPYYGYAWPVAFETLPPDARPIALGVWSKNLLILTNGRPYLVSGDAPELLTEDPIDFEQSCIAPRSVQSMAGGVVWASPDGLCYYGSGGPRILTAGLMTQSDWKAINPASIIGAQFEGLYLGSYLDGSTRKAFVIDPGAPEGLTFLASGFSAAYFDRLTDSLYLLNGTSVQKWHASTSKMTATFKSKVFRSPRPVNMGWLEVVADAFPVTVTLTSSWRDAEGDEQSVSEVRTIQSTQPVALMSGFQATDFQLDVATSVGGVQGVTFATSREEIEAA